MTEQLFNELCKLGNEADSAYNKGNLSPAFENYNQILGTMLEIGDIDSFLVSKGTLGILLSFIMAKQLKEANQIWTTDQDSLYWIGIDGLENGQVSINDTILYMQVCAYLNAHSEGKSEKRADKVSSLYYRICQFTDHVFADKKAVMITNWFLLLKGIFPEKIPEKYNDMIDSIECDDVSESECVVFLEPSKWVITWDAPESDK
ncbi:hypothetical protein KAJ27_00885 [bacterium]|nr:hypothetical protein [bacterium]